MIRISLTLMLLLVWAAPAVAQTLTWSGFVKTDYIYDTRQVVSAREAHFELFPAAFADADNNGKDDNATPNVMFASFQTRLALDGAGTQAFGANVTARVEGDFFGGPTDASVSNFILRRAFVKLDWGNREVLLGQEWSPMFTVSMFPGTVSFNTGAPFNPFARFPMAAYTLKSDKLRFTMALSQQRDAFQSISGRNTQHRAGVPGGHLNLQMSSGGNIIGAGVYGKALRPTLDGDLFWSGMAMAYGRFNTPALSLSGKVFYGGDAADHLMVGGYVRQGPSEYVPLNTLASWVDLEVKNPGKPVQFGLFGGYTQNMGAPENGAATQSYARAANLHALWRVAPRVSYTAGRVRLSGELEVSQAQYGVPDAGDRLRVNTTGVDPVMNVRGLFAAYYTF